jgi:hypothetical protein
MAVWVVIAVLGVLKLPLVGMMLWLPFRSDPAPGDVTDSSQDDGGSKTLPGGWNGHRHPRGPLPRLPRRGPHGSAPAPSPGRVRPLRAVAPHGSGRLDRH